MTNSNFDLEKSGEMRHFWDISKHCEIFCKLIRKSHSNMFDLVTGSHILVLCHVTESLLTLCVCLCLQDPHFPTVHVTLLTSKNNRKTVLDISPLASSRVSSQSLVLVHCQLTYANDYFFYALCNSANKTREPGIFC